MTSTVRRRTAMGERLRELVPMLRANPGFGYFMIARTFAIASRVAQPFYIIYVGKQIGLSGTTIGELSLAFLGADTVAQNTYWKATPPSLNYGALFLVGVILGAFASALAAGKFRIETVPAVWRERFGASPTRRFTWAFLAGALEMYGARMAGGCTSGHSLSGGMQLALSSWVFTIVIFAAAIATGQIIYRSAR